MNTPQPTDIKLLQKSRILELAFDNGDKFYLPCEYLRVYSPSAEVQGHGQGQVQWPRNKQDVNIIAIEPVGQYAIKLVFDDEHNTGIYSWQYLYELASNQEENWQTYLDAVGKVVAS